MTSGEAVQDTAADARVRIEIPNSEEQETVSFTGSKHSPPTKGVKTGIVVAVVTVLLLIIAGLAGTVGYFLYRQKSLQEKGTVSSGSNSTDKEVERLKKRVDELGNRIPADETVDEDSTTPEITPTPDPEDDKTEYDDEVIRRVNSPNDGFLALRDRPDARSGSRIAKIPHGDIVVVERCLEEEVTIGQRTGHWCRTRWEGLSGWVFDAWLID